MDLDLGRRLRRAISSFTGKTYIDERAVKELIKELQRTLIAADVDVRLVLKMTKEIEKKALELEKKHEVSIKEQIVKLVYDHLVELLGESYTPTLEKKKILLMGLYGSGKTTTAVKLAKFYKSKGLKSLVVCADTDRPAAYEQLEQLAKQAGVGFYGIKGEKNPVKIVESAKVEFDNYDVIIVDTSGRNALEEDLIKEIKAINEVLNPNERILVISADIGHVVEKQAQAFNEAIGVNGIIVTKADGSAKAGGALSAAHKTGAKVMFIGTGEHLSDIRPYDSKKYVAKLLGFPDLEALIDKIKELEKEIDPSKLMSEELTMESFLEQIRAAKKMGPLKDVFGMLGAHDVPDELIQQSEEKMKKYEAIINSMTPEERKNADLIKRSLSRIQRIAMGSGTDVKDVKELLKQYDMLKKMMGGFKHDRSFRKKIERMMKRGIRI